MRRMFFQLAPASIFICLAILLLSSGLHAQGDVAKAYKTNCVLCHAADGSASTTVGKSLKIRDLRSAEVQSQTDDQLFAIVASGKGKMPGFEKSLGADACKALIAHIRTLKQ